MPHTNVLPTTITSSLCYSDVKTSGGVFVSIQYDGVTNYYNTPYLIDLISSGYQIIPDFEIPVPEQFVYPEQRRHMYVPGSAEATVSIVGTCSRYSA